MTKRNSFSREFKLEAVRLLEQGDKDVSVLARELGVPRNRLYKWREEIKESKGPGSIYPKYPAWLLLPRGLGYINNSHEEAE